MRLCINLDISKSVTKEEWKNMYEETLFLVKVFPLAELQERRIQGEMSPCLVRTQEHTITYGPNEKYIRVGWSAAGNYEDLNFATECFLPRCLPVKNYYDPDAGDAMLGVIRKDGVYSLWEVDTEGKSYFIYLLAIGCLIQARLGAKAHVYGDITLEQYGRAVSLANQYLDKPIEMPEQCDKDRLCKRISRIAITDKEKEDIFFKVYTNPDPGSFKFDISPCEHLIHYKKGDTLCPAMERALGISRYNLDMSLDDDEYWDLMDGDTIEQFEWVTDNGVNLLILRDKDWERIFSEIEDNYGSFGRYYQLFSMGTNCEELRRLQIAMLVNDDLYAYSKVLAEQKEE